jgi:OOP family OmpA-OmpF porin
VHRPAAVGVSSLVLSLLCASEAFADPVPQVDLRGFHASVDPNSGLYLEPADSPKTGDWNAGVLFNYSYRPVTLEATSTSKIKAPAPFHVISNQVTGDFVGAVGLWHRVLVGVDVPFLIFQNGDKSTADTTRATGDLTLPRQALGDVGLNLKTTLIRPTASELGGFALAIHERFTLPTGDEQSFMGEGTPTSETRLLAEYRLVALGVHGALGVKFRGHEGSFACGTFASITDCPSRFESEIPFGLGVTLRPQALGIDPKGRLMFFAETHGYLPLAPIHPFQGEAVSEVQVDVGSRMTFGSISLLAGFEKGLLHAVGTPNVRATIGISWVPRVHDRDGDGIPDDVDQCPDLPEDFDGFQDADGCPDGDNDDDGIPDAEDACPNQAGPPNPDPKKNGCPVPGEPPPPKASAPKPAAALPDRDKDGIADKDDACPDVAGKPSTDPKQNGCPDADVDHDTFVGAEDKCPNEPEDFNGFEDDDGCPDAQKKEAKNLFPLVIAKEKDGIVTFTVQKKVGFVGDGIDPATINVLRAIASELSKHPTWVATVGVRGKANQDPAIAKKSAEVIVAKLNALARRPDAALAGEWKDTKTSPRSEEFGVGFLVSEKAGKK